MNKVTWAKVAINLATFSFLIYLFVGLFLSWLGPNPVEVIIHQTGEWSLHFLLATLAISPLRRRFHWNVLIKFRRFLGLWAFAFVSLHLLVFLFFDHFFDWISILEDVLDRLYITVGFVGFVLMLPLAITSLKSLQKAMGKRWITLHRLVYAVGIAGIVHYWWLVKADNFWPLVYSTVLVALLGERLLSFYKKYASKKRPLLTRDAPR